MKKSLEEYLAYKKSEQEFPYLLRMEYEWLEPEFEKMITLINAVLEDYKDEIVIPKSIAYFFTKEIEQIIGITSKDIFFNYIPDGYTKEEYIQTVENGCAILLKMKEDFFK